MHLKCRFWSYTPKSLNRQTTYKIHCLSRMHRKNTVWFPVVRSYLRQKFIITDASRSRQLDSLGYFPLDFLGNIYCKFLSHIIFSNVKESFVQ